MTLLIQCAFGNLSELPIDNGEQKCGQIASALLSCTAAFEELRALTLAALWLTPKVSKELEAERR